MSTDTPAPTLDTRKTSAEKLTALRELANEMATVSAREPNNQAMQKLAWYSERINRLLDGDFA